MADKKDLQLRYRIIKIQTVKFSFEDINEKEFTGLTSAPENLKIDVSSKINLNKEDGIFTIDISTRLYNSKDNFDLVLHTGRTAFEVQNLDVMYSKEKDAFDLPDTLLTQLYSLSYTHARALLATELNPTVFRDKYFLPVVDPKSLFPKNITPTDAKK